MFVTYSRPVLLIRALPEPTLPRSSATAHWLTARAVQTAKRIPHTRLCPSFNARQTSFGSRWYERMRNRVGSDLLLYQHDD